MNPPSDPLGTPGRGGPEQFRQRDDAIRMQRSAVGVERQLPARRRGGVRRGDRQVPFSSSMPPTVSLTVLPKIASGASSGVTRVIEISTFMS